MTDSGDPQGRKRCESRADQLDRADTMHPGIDQLRPADAFRLADAFQERPISLPRENGTQQHASSAKGDNRSM
ncbi:MAG: hypothetical protein PF508_07490 [Spirochaeta sp.]|jgi:hypothetical protein|nr:hypothetical protein [Spirochaeta sp.]